MWNRDNDHRFPLEKTHAVPQTYVEESEFLGNPLPVAKNQDYRRHRADEKHSLPLETAGSSGLTRHWAISNRERTTETTFGPACQRGNPAATEQSTGHLFSSPARPSEQPFAFIVLAADSPDQSEPQAIPAPLLPSQSLFLRQSAQLFSSHPFFTPGTIDGEFLSRNDHRLSSERRTARAAKGGRRSGAP
jgi:hypothetical protein